MVGPLKALFSSTRDQIGRRRLARRWERLRARGMRIGHNVWLPASTWIDTSYCFLISIGDNCGFGEECHILAHDAQMDEFLDAARLGRVTVHESCHVGAKSILLPGVEIGPRTIVGAGSVVSKSLPADTVCAGNPARVICSLQEYLEKHRTRLAGARVFPYSIELSADQREALLQATASSAVYITGGHSAELRGEGGTPRTALPARTVEVSASSPT